MDVADPVVIMYFKGAKKLHLQLLGLCLTFGVQFIIALSVCFVFGFIHLKYPFVGQGKLRIKGQSPAAIGYDDGSVHKARFIRS
jgi:hypothetical protein